jgi:hypothetical protein
MKKLLALLLLFGIVGCGPSSDEKERIAAVTCSIIKETKNFESSVRVEKINKAREKIKLPPYLDGDEEIIRSLNFNTCELLVKNDESYFEKTNELEKYYLAELERLATEKKAEEARLAAEMKRLAAEKKAEEERLAFELEAEKERRKAELLAEYNLNKELINTQSIKACEQLKVSEGTIRIKESHRYVSDEEKNEIKTKFLKSITEDVPDDYIFLAVLYGKFRNDTDFIKEKRLSNLSPEKKRGVQCLDSALPKSCEAIMELPLVYKYFPDETEAELLELSENVNQCSELML